MLKLKYMADPIKRLSCADVLIKGWGRRPFLACFKLDETIPHNILGPAV